MHLKEKNLFVVAVSLMFVVGCGEKPENQKLNVENKADQEEPSDVVPEPEEQPAEENSEEKADQEEPGIVTPEPEEQPAEANSEENTEEEAGDKEAASEPEEQLPQAVLDLKDKADQGQALAQTQLAALYESGREGVTKNLNKAAILYRKAAEQGRADAQYNLGMLYESGLGVAKDPEEAARWFRIYNETNRRKNK